MNFDDAFEEIRALVRQYKGTYDEHVRLEKCLMAIAKEVKEKRSAEEKEQPPEVETQFIGSGAH